MAEHHALLSVHHEVIAAPQIKHLPSYRSHTEVTAYLPSDVGKQVPHVLSDQLAKRYPYPEPAHYDDLQPTVAYGRQGVTKTMGVLRRLVQEPDDAVRSLSEDAILELKQANIQKVNEAMYDHSVVGDTVTGENADRNVELLKVLLADKDPVVKRGAAEVLGRFSSILQGRKAVCSSGCAESLGEMLEDPDSADVRLAAGKTLHILTQSIDGRDDVVLNVAEGKVVVMMVKALLVTATRERGIITPKLTPVLLESLANLLMFDDSIVLALKGNIMDFVVRTLRLRTHNVPALKCLCSLCGHPDGKRAAINCKALQALSGLLASEKPVERQLSARAVLCMCVDDLGKQQAAVVVPNLVQQLYEEDHDLYMNALLAIRTISEWPETRAYVKTVLRDDPETFESVFKDHQIHLAAFRFDSDKPPRV
uniref:Radial spoke protein 8 n=1 Tax=Hemiselmis tepida TaxID=464990 RepID=A0A7S0Z6F1_9CRYP|mmetsp:Transcript_5881/g.15085  ORF Transcript_5881/g.15085 Transcript_5881/m.15085 type:complete len:423 (+) Transcript_5881:92-1360(+)